MLVHVASVVVPVVDAAGVPAEPISDGAVAVDGDRIVAVGRADDVLAAHPGARLRRWDGVLTPGLVNAHTHLQFSGFADLGADPPSFGRWLIEMGKRRRRTGGQEWAEAARTGAFLALRSGTTSVADVVTDDAALLPVARSGLGGISYLEVVAVGEHEWSLFGARKLDARLVAVPSARAVGIAPHSPVTLGPTALRDLAAIATDRGLRLHVHLAESEDELQLLADGTGPAARMLEAARIDTGLAGVGVGTSPTEYVDGLGVLGPTTHVAHGVHVDAADRARLRERGTAVALCVRSNRVLDAGRAPVADYLAEGSPLAIGTDSLASSPSLDMWEEAAAVAAQARHQGYDGDDLDRRVVEAATIGGARALGLADAGGLFPGARADLAVFDVPAGGDPYAALVAFGGGSCRATVLAGRIVHRR